MRGSPDELEGLSRLSTWFGASNVRERGKGESFVPAKLCCRPPQAGRLEALHAWIAGTSLDKPGHDDKG
jgi:hypothetical protein